MTCPQSYGEAPPWVPGCDFVPCLGNHIWLYTQTLADWTLQVLSHGVFAIHASNLLSIYIYIYTSVFIRISISRQELFKYPERIMEVIVKAVGLETLKQSALNDPNFTFCTQFSGMGTFEVAISLVQEAARKHGLCLGLAPKVVATSCLIYNAPVCSCCLLAFCLILSAIYKVSPCRIQSRSTKAVRNASEKLFIQQRPSYSSKIVLKWPVWHSQ